MYKHATRKTIGQRVWGWMDRREGRGYVGGNERRRNKGGKKEGRREGERREGREEGMKEGRMEGREGGIRHGEQTVDGVIR